MIRIAICDDELMERERAHNLLARYVQEQLHYETTIVSFSTALELLSYVKDQGGFDIVVLDVYMAGMLGTEAARELRRLGDHGEIIFLTTSRDHTIDAFEVGAAQYVNKPYTENTFYSAIDKVLTRLHAAQRHMITLHTSEGRVRLMTEDIVYIEASRNNHQIIHTIQEEKLEVPMAAEELFGLLSRTKDFVRCDASMSINLKYVRQIKKNVILLDSGKYITYPYRSYHMLKEKFLHFQMSPGE